MAIIHKQDRTSLFVLASGKRNIGSVR